MSTKQGIHLKFVVLRSLLSDVWLIFSALFIIFREDHKKYPPPRPPPKKKKIEQLQCSFEEVCRHRLTRSYVWN